MITVKDLVVCRAIIIEDESLAENFIFYLYRSKSVFLSRSSKYISTDMDVSSILEFFKNKGYAIAQDGNKYNLYEVGEVTWR